MLVKIFEEQVKKHPHKIAVRWEKGFLTYLELNRFANRVARLIEKKCTGVGKGERIGLLFDHGVFMIVAILGTLKAGGVYVPLSVDYPGNRISHMLSDSKSFLLLSHSRYLEMAEKLAGENGIDFITIDKPACPIPEEDKQREVRSSQLAYIMYTSGSTGKPKGVMQTHENVMYFIKNWAEKFSITNGDRMTLFSSFCHDASIPDLFTGLHNGALLYPYSMKSREENIELSHFLVRERINIWHSVPSLFSYFANTLRREEQFRDLRLIILGGEAVREHEVRLFKKYFPYAALANLYGQTEATFVSVQLIGHEDNFERVTIGTPIDGTRVFVIDEQGNPVEPLEPGEILVVCDHVSPGYWQQKEATAAAFGEAEEFGKLYWTGDLGCLLPEGEIEFLGRKDFQVKIRGFRIELGEIESQLLKHDKISETVVVSREDENGDKYLCAYIVASAANAIPASTELREYLSQILPDYMIPSYFMQLEKLPLTPNGKIDRKALPHSVMKTEGAYVPPGNPMEMKLASLWAGILGLEKKVIGINHNFFSLGGHSLKAVSLIAKIHREFNVKLPLALVFKRPTIRGIAASIQKAVKDEFSAITPIEKKEYYALSSAQKRLYFLQQLDLNSTGYNMPFTLPLGKDIEKDKLESTLKQLISRHEGLRTSFVMIGEEPYQRIHDDVAFKIEYYDLQVTGALTHGHRCRWEQEGTGGLAPLPIDHAAALISSFIRPFDLTREPLIRSRLIKQPDNSFIWMVDMHHIVSDGTSNVILAEDFMSRYKGEELPSLPLQYKDFSHWQTDLFTRARIKSQEDYWLSLYSGEIPRLQLPTDFKRPKVFTFTGDRYRFKLEGEDAVKSRKLAHRHGGTLYMNILAVLNVLFYKYTGQKDIIIGSGTAGRSRADLQRIIGMFVNTLAMRNHPEGHKTYESFLEEVVANSVNAFENQDVQFEELVDRLVQERDTSRNPLFDISMVVQNFQKIGKTGSTGENTGQVEVLPMVNENLPPIILKNPTSKFDMTFFVHEASDNIHIIIEYYTGIFKPDSIKRLTWHFQTITRTIIENPAIKLMEIDIISEEEKKQVLYEFNDTEADYPRFKTLHAIFEDQAAQAPDHIAVVQGESMQFTYRQLNESAQKIARYLYRQKEVKPGEPVGIWMSPLLIRPVAVLGILKAGGVYVPLDPLLPQQRLKYMIRDSCINIVISEKKYLKDLNRLQWECDCFNSYLCVDSEDIHRENILEKPEPPVKKKAKRKHQDDMSCPGSFGHDTNSGLISTVWSHNPAYIIYTSGTTGMPKGVMIEHRSVVNLCYWHNRMYQITRSDHAALYAGFGFDASAWELFPYLLTGAALYMVDESLQLDIEGLNRYFQRCHITIGFLPTQLCEQFMCLDNTNSSLRVLLTGGDKLRTFTPRGYRLYNNYGPTENTVVTTAYPVTAFSENIPIGKPIDNSRIYILDKESYHLQPPGIPGELCIAGAGLARGYLNRPELTKDRFCLRRPGGALFIKTAPPGPPRKNFLLGEIPGKKRENNQKLLQGVQGDGFLEKSPPGRRRHKIYRTGDLARWLPDGNIEFIGRIDAQVKIRGYRIELGEIESRLLTHHSIKETVVVDRDDNSGDKYLCAYIVSSEPVENLDKYLSRWLPDYMIPSYFVPMEKIPLTPNSKVDRSKLSKPGITSKEAYLPPRDKIEEKLAEIWSEVLGLSHHSIGIDDNFFKLGGHSLKATALVSRIHKNLNVKISLVQAFKTPTVRELSGYIKNAAKERYAAIQPIEKKEYYSQSSPQKRLYVLQQMQENNIGYNMPRIIPLTFTGKTAKEKLEYVFKKLIARHESLRTSFHMMDNEPVQKIHDRVEFEIEYREVKVEVGDNQGTRGLAPLSEEPAPSGPQPAGALVSTFIRPFDLSQAPLLRIGLMALPHTTTALRGHPRQGTYNSQKENEQQYILVIDMHHIITDAASQAILKDEFQSLYNGKSLPLLKLQYKDYAQWQNSKQQKALIAHQKTYWINVFSLSGEIPVLNLPIDYPRPINQDFAGSTVNFLLKEAETQTLEKIAKNANATLYMTVLSVFYLLLAKLSSQEDIIVGTPIAARRHTDLERIIGMFVNTLALRNYPSAEKTFTGFLQEVKKRTLKAFENQEYQFEELVDNLDVSRDTGRNPLFDVMFNWLNRADYHDNQYNETNSKMEISQHHLYQHQKGVSKFDLTLTVVHLEKKLLFVVEYCTKLFKPLTIDRIIGYFRKILDLLSRDPDQQISAIEIITAVEKRQILYEFNDTQSPFPENKNIHQLFAEQVQRTPDHIAVVGTTQIKYRTHMTYTTYISYHELNQKSTQLAHALKEKGIKPDTIVGLMLDRSIEMFIGIFGILTAGGAYLPIDPQYPEERIDYMLKDSGAKILLKDNDFTPKAFNNRPKGTSSHLHLQPAPATSLAYIIYTSGTTGKPKGVHIEHISVVNILTALSKRYPLPSQDTYLLKTSYTFDVSITELFGWFWEGGRVTILGKNHEKEPRKILDTIEHNRVTHINFVPSMFGTFLEILNPDNIHKLSQLKYIFLAGEALSPHLVKKFNRLVTGVVLENLYGPTEATIYASQYSLSQWNGNGGIPIGKPLANLKLHILDRYDHPQPPGVVGELCIAGIALARGYLNHPELTAEKFCLRRPGGTLFEKTAPPGPPRKNFFLSHSPIYHTGDLARWLSDGNIEFLGRIDQQVKIRGFRIELGEIENQLLKHDSINKAVVISKEDQNKEKYLCAYFVSNRDLPVTELREYLSKVMPDYMIPAYFVQIEKIPLNVNGKIDRKALPEPAIKTKENFIPPEDLIEKQLTAIWSEILCRDPEQASQLYESIGINDNFFELGGHSLKATAVIIKIQKEFHVNLSLAKVFNTPTIKQLAEYIKTHNKEINLTKDNGLVLLKKGKNSTNHLFFIHDGSGKVEGYINFCNSLDPGYNCWGIKAEEFDNYAPKNIKIEELAAQYIKKLEMIQPSGPYYIVGWSLGGTIAFEMVNRLEQKNQIVDFLAIIDAPPPNRDSAPPPNEFTLESELKWSKNYLPPDIYKKIQNASSTNHLWEVITAHLESDGINIEAVLKRIKKLLAQYGGRGITNNQNLSISEMIRDLNVLRSFNQARAAYIPSGKINTSIRYFKASESEKINHKTWEKYSIKPLKVYEIQGDHYSIFRPPQVAVLAKKFEKIRRKTTCF